jgi:hypothetical protein
VLLVLKVKIIRKIKKTPVSIIIKKRKKKAHVGIKPTPYIKPIWRITTGTQPCLWTHAESKYNYLRIA